MRRPAARHRPRGPILWFVAVAVVLVLSGCTTSTPVARVTAGVVPTSEPTSAPSEIVASPPVSTPTAHDGCSPTGGSIPKGAVSAPIGDVDGDGRPDREWSTGGSSLTVGVLTASGALISLTQGFAGGGTRSAFVSPLAHGTVAVASEQRSAVLFAFVDCRFVHIDTTGTGRFFALIGQPVEGAGAPQYVGAGTACRSGRLFATRDDYVGGTAASIAETPLTVAADGQSVTLGPAEIVTRRPTAAEASAAGALHCGSTKVLYPDGG